MICIITNEGPESKGVGGAGIKKTEDQNQEGWGRH